jgi:hypothetical protein
MVYGTAVHRCACGCGEKVVTPFSPTDWKLIFDGETVSLHPSIGNWNFKCRSHYWIRENRVDWAPQWSAEEIAAGRAADQRAKDGYFGGKIIEKSEPRVEAKTGTYPGPRGAWAKMSEWWSRMWP